MGIFERNPKLFSKNKKQHLIFKNKYKKLKNTLNYFLNNYSIKSVLSRIYFISRKFI